VRYLPDKKKTKIRLPFKLSLLRTSRPTSSTASPQQCTQSAQDFIQIGSLSAELQPNGPTPDRYITLITRRGQRNKLSYQIARGLSVPVAAAAFSFLSHL